jgi:hypothetical protein
VHLLIGITSIMKPGTGELKYFHVFALFARLQE